MKSQIVTKLSEVPDWYTADRVGLEDYFEKGACIFKRDDNGRVTFWLLETQEEIDLAEWITRTEPWC